MRRCLTQCGWESTTEVGSESEYDDPFATVDQSELTMLDGDEELAESAEATIDWDDYLFEAINQLVPDTVPKDFVKKGGCRYQAIRGIHSSPKR
ncbi:hypothetical protein PGT21_022644 [Puccinia graminis f. sp. tritici]|uniref:Uncharacterized protein n=1 Tax=Puccinia graminis f. sp. tritici TaxID=56615 RepID=A0A5B0MPB5_PUCGR|nr:hypothetical protein PGT21_022644 [Puccinia graminis f. sp. tritici]